MSYIGKALHQVYNLKDHQPSLCVLFIYYHLKKVLMQTHPAILRLPRALTFLEVDRSSMTRLVGLTATGGTGHSRGVNIIWQAASSCRSLHVLSSCDGHNSALVYRGCNPGFEDNREVAGCCWRQFSQQAASSCSANMEHNVRYRVFRDQGY